jgi:6-phosphogluconolactonase
MKFVISSYKRNYDTIALFDVDIISKTYKKLSSADILAPSFVVSHKDYLYTYQNLDVMKLVAFQVEDDNLVMTDTVLLPGTGVTHLTYSLKNKLLIGCSYGDGTYFSFGANKGRLLKPYTYKRQIMDERLSRCHCVLLNKKEDNVAIVNIALDAIYLYDIVKNELVYKDVIELPTGVGPRHAIYNDDNSLMYIMTEYSNEVIIAEMKTKKVIQRISTIYNYPDKTFGATLLFSKNRKYLYASNRGEDSIAKFEVLENGMLEYVNSFSCGGKHPRHMKLSPDGKYLISCNMHENNVAIIDLNKEEVILTIPFDEASGITFLDK